MPSSFKRKSRADAPVAATSRWTADYKSMSIGQLAEELVRIMQLPHFAEYEQRRRFILNELVLRSWRETSTG